MKSKSNFKSTVLRITLVLCIIISLGLMYYVNMIERKYIIFSNPAGPTETNE